MMDRAQKEKERDSHKGKDVKQIHVGSLHNNSRSETLKFLLSLPGHDGNNTVQLTSEVTTCTIHSHLLKINYIYYIHYMPTPVSGIL